MFCFRKALNELLPPTLFNFLSFPFRTLMSKQYPEGMPFHGPVLNRKEASAVALFSAFELKTFR